MKIPSVRILSASGCKPKGIKRDPAASSPSSGLTSRMLQTFGRNRKLTLKTHKRMRRQLEVLEKSQKNEEKKDVWEHLKEFQDRFH